MFNSVNPYTGETIQSYAPFPDEKTQSILTAVHSAHNDWASQEVSERLQPLRVLGELLRRKKSEYAKIISQEMGKPISQAIAEIEKCADCCDFYAKNSEDWLASEQVFADEKRGGVLYQPLGVILAIMPWNFPFWQVIRAAVPAITAGNAVLLKHASNVSGSAFAIEKLFRDAGFPDDIIRVILTPTEDIPQLIADPMVRGVTLTGSTRAGKAVAEVAGAHLKPVVLELGGNDPYLVFDDADLELAVEKCVTGRLMNAGQSCIAAKRWIVHESLFDAFKGRAIEAMQSWNIGDPLSKETQLGVMVSNSHRAALHRQVLNCIDQGAQCLLGGSLPTGKSAFYPATLLAMPKRWSFDEELFGPVACMHAFSDEDAAVELANGTKYGLGAAVFTQDLERGRRVAGKIRSGAVAINDLVRSDPRLPFGGIKESGIGRELAREGLRAFVNQKALID